jgi:signal transduction histidine kinase
MTEIREATREELLERLTNHRTLSGVPREELEWLVAHGEIAHYSPGDIIVRTGEPADGLNIVLSGHFGILVDRGLGPRKVLEWRAGDLAGLLPYSRMTGVPGDTIVEEATETLRIKREHFRELTRECPEVTAKCVHVMLDRARIFKSSDLHDEKMMSLGRLAAGLAHELNNPASAAARSAKLLESNLAEADQASRDIGAANLSEGQLQMIMDVRNICLRAPQPLTDSPLERADREDEIADWLEAHGADTGSATTLADTAVTIDSLDKLAATLPEAALGRVLRWIAVGCTLRSVSSDIANATSRVHTLVSAIKKFTYMDRAAAVELMDVGQGLADTLPMLRAKARSKSIEITIEVQPDLPHVRGFGGELNQVWMNLIDNALDAAPESGHVQVSAVRELAWVVVRVIDDGPGIPPEIRDRIFDAFFTTKPVGQGTGLGLEIARHLVDQHGGFIKLDTHPGRTEFRVSLPVPSGDGQPQ